MPDLHTPERIEADRLFADWVDTYRAWQDGPGEDHDQLAAAEQAAFAALIAHVDASGLNLTTYDKGRLTDGALTTYDPR